MKHELGQMRSQGSGAIVNNSSLGGLVGLPGRAAYHATKHGVIGLTRSAALEYAPRGIRINAICPGTIATPMVTDMIDKGELDLEVATANQPINRLGTAEEIAASVLWLTSPGASFITGVALPVDGGYTAQYQDRSSHPRPPGATCHPRIRRSHDGNACSRRQRPEGLRHRPRLHDHDRRLQRPARPQRHDPAAPAGRRPRCHVLRHRRDLRPARQRGARR